ncbi:xylan O-acetyltransferase 12-like [Curcuma longa]|uniref:xylan O-acetyltransferase 12-like n=1 Tax=Curcuma longa TaxID=136217 RepID=UPI003D9E9350
MDDMAKKSNHAAAAHLVPFLLSLILVLVIAISLSYDKVNRILPISTLEHQEQEAMRNDTTVSDAPSTELEGCDLFTGRWVFDEERRPLYSGLQCEYMHDEVACEKYGRRNLKHQQWRWQPNGCNIPTFDARKLLTRLTGKRMVFVGDSLNRNQWVSMVCMVESFISSESKSMIYNGSLMSFRAKDFNASIDFYWSPLLVESNCDDPVHHRKTNRIMRANSIETHARRWADADILVFNSYLWWKKPGMKMKVLHGSFEDEIKNVEELEMVEGFELALKEWSSWLELNHNPNAELFFVSLSPTHVWGDEWGAASNQNCYNETEPIHREGYASRGSDYKMLHMVENTITKMRRKGLSVQLLNITQLSEYRKDGHPSVYRRYWVNLTQEQLANPTSYSDCTHWCVPGVPDAWNELLYSYIVL